MMLEPGHVTTAPHSGDVTTASSRASQQGTVGLRRKDFSKAVHRLGLVMVMVCCDQVRGPHLKPKFKYF